MIDAQRLERRDLMRLLTATGDLQEQLFEHARQARADTGQDEVVLRGVIEVSNYCQKNCRYCAMRCRNEPLQRYRLMADQILSVVADIKAANISIAFLQSGQDPWVDDVLEEVIPAIKKDFNLDVLLCLGEKPKEVYQRYAELGADSFILKFETSDDRLYRDTIGGPPTRRLQCLDWIREAGLKLGTGNMVGLPGQTLDSLVEDICCAITVQPDFVSSSPFIPNHGTPYEGLPHGDIDITLNTLAIWRIALSACLIPTVSALEKIREDGQLMGLKAGANVMTINFTPDVYRRKYAIYSKERFVVSLEHALETIGRAGLRVRVPSRSARSPEPFRPGRLAGQRLVDSSARREETGRD